MSDDEVIAALTQVKGIGRWSAEMFLMFRLHRPDVLPVGDLGIVNAVKNVYRLRKKPTRSASARSAKHGGLPVGRLLVSVAKPRQRTLTVSQRMNRLHLCVLFLLPLVLSHRLTRSRPRPRRSGTSPTISARRPTSPSTRRRGRG